MRRDRFIVIRSWLVSDQGQEGPAEQTAFHSVELEIEKGLTQVLCLFAGAGRQSVFRCGKLCESFEFYEVLHEIGELRDVNFDISICFGWRVANC